MNNDTIFTQIINRQIPSYIIYEDNKVISFLDINQFTKGHTLIVTKQEYTNITEVPENTFLHLFKIVQKISKTLIKTLKPKGLNIINNNGIIAGQTIFHFHIHLLPRFNEKEIIFNFNKNSKLNSEYFTKIQKNIINNIK
ncbi:Diadenosine tetraphosphate hydrolase (AppppA hydrolase [Candidatus Phytoplasma mali]|uniref:Diadenosine tetraphosphate hydrolase (AppppA hydrolase) n=1 Tax=Phytoplasma mali (strain AT) TaxID=482235 RepID=B3R0F4_PHYMT|nr:HIT domain-containing protein [Candidatus Phytoplasma mali]CAP18318.1 Diadenosine tetraphosphate hydrolase (AppppA hydrolase [Candidatus Phytoplasma mali]